MIKHFFSILFLTTSLCYAIQPLSHFEVMEHVEKKLPHVGRLKILNDFLYLDIEDEYIHELSRIIEQEGFEKPPYFGIGLVGAHITVAYPNELSSIIDIEEIDQDISFTPIDVNVVEAPKNGPFAKANYHWIYLIEVAAPELESIRLKYGLSKAVHPFHITIGIKK